MKKFLTALVLILAAALSVVFAACKNSNDKIQFTFETNGGVEISSVELNSGDDYTLPVPVKDGYEFEGWYLSDDLTGNAVTQITASENATFYAKWVKLYSVSLDAAGGTISGTTFKLKEGANLFEALEDYVPTKTDYRFDAWLNGATEVTKNAKMPASDITLTARYKVKYIIEIYKENVEGTGYVKDNTLEDYGYVGVTLSPDIDSEYVAGYTKADVSEAVTSLTLSATASANVLKFYYDRMTYSVICYANYPDGTNTIVSMESAKSGEKVTLPDELVSEGYCFVGWALSSTGDVVYKVDSITGKLFNAPEGTVVGEAPTVEVKDDMALYAVWVKGYTNMLGGKDVVFLFDEKSGEAYLCRNGVYFVGEYSATSQRVTFVDDDVELYFEAKLINDGTFVYFSDLRSVAVYDYFGVNLNGGKAVPYVSSSTQLHFDGFNGITYTVTDKDGMTSSSNGVFYVDEDGYYIATFSDGDLAGQTLTVWLSSALVNGVPTNVFRVRNDQELALGTVYRTALYNGQLTYYTSYYSITFNGFGVASYFDGSSQNNYYCFLDGENLTLASTSGIFGVTKLSTINSVTCYSVYNQSSEFTANNGNDTLALDGYGVATYKKGNAEVSGYYSIESSGFGDYLVRLYVKGSEYSDFIITVTKNGEDEAAQYAYQEKPAGYSEYLYTDEQSIYLATYLVLNDESVGTASIYCTDKEGNKFKVSTGTYESVSGLYVYTTKTWSIPEGLEVPFKVADFSSFVFTLGTRTASGNTTYNVNYWTEYTVGDNNFKLYTEYTCEGDSLALLDFGSIALYMTKDGESYVVGSYSISKSTGVLTLTVSSSTKLYFILDEDGKTFEKLAYAPYSLNSLTEKWEVNKNVYISFDGRLNSNSAPVCYYNVVNEDGTVTVKGYMTSNEDYIYTFTSDDGKTTFTFKIFTANSTSYISIYNEKYAGTYVSDYGVLILDGYGSSAIYDGADNMYLVAAEGVVAIRTDDGYVYADVNVEDKTFTVRGSEYGTYFYSDNQYLNGYRFYFDGYGKLSVYTLKSTEDGNYEADYLDENGKYEINGDTVVVTYNNKNSTVTLEGRFGTLTYNSQVYNTFVLSYDEISQSFVNENDWSVLELDGNGNAVKYSADGTIENGTYTIVSESLFYYVNSEGTDAAIYKYNMVAGTATPLKLRARGYYTADMESLLFSQYGFAIFNGSTRYYYDVDNDQVTIYRHAEEGESGANKYGYIKQAFGKFTNTLTLENKTYYYNEGYNITFNREKSDASKYPLPINFGTKDEPVYASIESIIFTPTGDNEAYSVSGIVVINKTQYNCTVSRSVAEDGTASYSLTISNYVYGISLKYGGLTEDADGNEVSASTFEVTSLTSVKNLYSDTYLTYYYIYYSFMGVAIPDNWGMMQLVSEYDESGACVAEYVNAAFGTSSNMYDVKGELITLTKVPYKYDSETGIYTASFKYSDGYQYNLVFAVVTNSYISSVSAYRIGYVTRTETITAGDYKLEIETIIASDVYGTSGIGMIYQMTLYKGDNKIELSNAVSASDGIYYVSREVDENGKIIATHYYLIELTRAEAEEDYKAVPVYSSVKITESESVKTYYDEASKSYVDVDTINNKVLYVYLYDTATEKGTGYAVKSCEYSEETSSYTVVLSSDKKYTVKIENGKVTLTENTSEGATSDSEEQN